ncbi:hypothetical protein LCGC14_0646860 [marine sediment metagenome]|uniref:Uncharacterized protein n=1 Tax=marine sediment metagenome TaxID=412755 RepID=A0A0F9R2Q5_9ZZZZ|nr:hypothetical protein [Pricia sp.]
MRLAETHKIIPVMALDTIASGGDGDSINMKGFHRCTFICTFGTLSGDAILTVNSGVTDGAKNSALTFNHAVGTATIGTYTSATVAADILAANATSAALTLTAASYLDKMLIVEVDASDMDLANDEEWLTLSLSNAGSSGAADAVAVLEPRYTSNASGSGLA